MPDPLAAMADLRETAVVLERLPDQPPAVARVLGALRRYERDASTGLKLEEALGLAVGPGGKPWWRLEATRRRDAELAALAQESFSGIDLSTAAREIARDAARYAATGWRVDRDRPADALPDKRRRLRRVLEANGGRPLCERRVRDILKNSDQI